MNDSLAIKPAVESLLSIKRQISPKDAIPEDLTFQILSWIPSDSLVRFKCVEKSWYSLIESPEFKAMQLCNHVQSDTDLCIIINRKGKEEGDETKQKLSMLVCNMKQGTCDGIEDSFTGTIVDIPYPLVDYNYYMSILTASNGDGILCLQPNRQNLVICNPGIREFRALPKSCIADDNDFRIATIGVGYGFDTKSNDLKVVRIWQRFYEGGYTPYGPALTEIYSFSSNSWREVEDGNCPCHCFGSRRLSVYWNGACYWFAGAYEYAEGILRFCTSDEVFEYLRLPCPMRDACLAILEHKGTLALTSYNAHNLDVWALDDFLVGGSLVKLFSIEIEDEYPLFFLSSDHLLMRNFSGKIYSCNLITKQRRILSIVDITGKEDFGDYDFAKGIFQAARYRRSLVSIKREDENGLGN